MYSAKDAVNAPNQTIKVNGVLNGHARTRAMGSGTNETHPSTLDTWSLAPQWGHTRVWTGPAKNLRSADTAGRPQDGHASFMLGTILGAYLAAHPAEP